MRWTPLLVALMAGCARLPAEPQVGSADIDAATLTYDWTSASVPSPMHTQLEINVSPDGSARIAFWPDYPGRARAVERDYRIDAAQMAALRRALVAAGVGQPGKSREGGAPTAPGKASEAIIVSRGEKITSLPATGEPQVAAAVAAFRATVPEAVWADFERLTPARDFRGA